MNAEERQAAPVEPTTNPWEQAARDAAVQRRVRALSLVGAHPGSGATTWTHLLDAEELDAPPASGRYVLVARTTVAGIEAAKPFTWKAAAVLLVADAPGRVPPEVRRAIKVLSGGGAPLVYVPWLPPLRGMAKVPDSPSLRKSAAKVAAALDNHRKGTP